MSVADLLQQSRDAHQRYRAALPNRQGYVGNAIIARGALQDAQTARLAAVAADPTHSDAAWKDEPITHDHDELLDFYAQQLAR